MHSTCPQFTLWFTAASRHSACVLDSRQQNWGHETGQLVLPGIWTFLEDVLILVPRQKVGGRGGMNNALLTICNCHNHHISPWPLSQTPGVILRPVFSLSIPFSLSFKISLIEPQCMKMIFKHSLRVYNVSLYQILCLHLSHFQLTTTLGWVLLCFCGCHDPGYLTQVLVYMGWALYHWAIPHPKGTVIKAMCQIIKSYLRSLRSAKGQGAVVWIGNVTMDSATDDLLASW